MPEPLTSSLPPNEDALRVSDSGVGSSLEADIATAAADDLGVVKKRLGPVFWISAVWLLFVVLVAMLAPVLPLKDADKIASGGQYESFSSEHWLGTDKLGRDLTARVVEGSRVSLIVGFGAIAAGLLIGGLIGLVAGARRGWTERILMSVIDVLLVFPAIILALAIVTFLGRDLRNIVLALAILSIAPIARLTRANTLQWSQREFVQAARVLGAKNRTIMFREVLPNVLMPMAYLALIGVAIVIVAEGTLAFLQVGSEELSWGKMVFEGKEGIFIDKPLPAFVPSMAIFLTVLSLNFMGERIRALSDVRESAI